MAPAQYATLSGMPLADGFNGVYELDEAAPEVNGKPHYVNVERVDADGPGSAMMTSTAAQLLVLLACAVAGAAAAPPPVPQDQKVRVSFKAAIQKQLAVQAFEQAGETYRHGQVCRTQQCL